MKILTISNAKEKKFLLKETKKFVFEDWKRQDIEKLVREMKHAMRKANGIGLAANQVGLSHRMFVAEVPGEKGKKFYAIFNPILEVAGDPDVLLEEGCLSVPEVYGTVKRYSKATLRGEDKKGKQIKIKAWGLLAHVFQHEVDHLDGKLFVQKAEEVYKVARSERLRSS